MRANAAMGKDISCDAFSRRTGAAADASRVSVTAHGCKLTPRTILQTFFSGRGLPGRGSIRNTTFACSRIKTVWLVVSAHRLFLQHNPHESLQHNLSPSGVGSTGENIYVRVLGAVWQCISGEAFQDARQPALAIGCTGGLDSGAWGVYNTARHEGSLAIWTDVSSEEEASRCPFKSRYSASTKPVGPWTACCKRCTRRFRTARWPSPSWMTRASS